MTNNSFSPDKTYFTSDTHFFHKNIISLCERPFENVEEMNAALIKNWNSVVPKDGVVFHLGDFCFGSISKYKEIRSQLNGKIYLIRGNHDFKQNQDNPERLNEIFEWVGDQIQIDISGQPIYLNHFPFLSFGGAHKKGNPVWQLFGHVHSRKNTNNNYFWDRLDVLLSTQYDVGVDNNNYTPVSYSDIKKIIDCQKLKTRGLICYME